MNEHESITADVKEAYVNEWDSYHGFQWSKELEQVFDTWLEEVKREAREQALESFRQGTLNIVPMRRPLP